MYLKTPVKIPDIKTGISEKKIKGTTYIYYEYGRKYYPDRKYTVPQCTSIGKVDADDPSMMFPNDNFLKYFPDIGLPEELPASSRSGCIKIGAWLVIRKVIQHYKLEEKLSGIIGENSGLFLDLVAYALITENNVAQYYPDYAYNHLLFTREMSSLNLAKVRWFVG